MAAVIYLHWTATGYDSTQPPTPALLTSLCTEAAAIARSWGWQEADISLQSVMSHAKPPPTAMAA